MQKSSQLNINNELNFTTSNKYSPQHWTYSFLPTMLIFCSYSLFVGRSFSSFAYFTGSLSVWSYLSCSLSLYLCCCYDFDSMALMFTGTSRYNVILFAYSHVVCRQMSMLPSSLYLPFSLSLFLSLHTDTSLSFCVLHVYWQIHNSLRTTIESRQRQRNTREKTTTTTHLYRHRLFVKKTVHTHSCIYIGKYRKIRREINKKNHQIE